MVGGLVIVLDGDYEEDDEELKNKKELIKQIDGVVGVKDHNKRASDIITEGKAKIELLNGLEEVLENFEWEGEVWK